MSRFNTIKFEYKGKTYTVPPERVMGLIDTIEEHITLAEIYADGSGRRTLRFGRLAAAYSAALNYAGAETTTEDVYLAMFGGAAEDGAETKAFHMMMTLMTIMTPPAPVAEKLEKTATSAKEGASSKKSGAAGSGRGSSGKPSSSPRAARRRAAGA